MKQRHLSSAALGAILAASPLALSAQTANLTILVNGNPVNFAQPPVERAGRVYVPLRGVFQDLGATVVYADGKITATRGRTTVDLRIGDPQATIDGQPQQLDSPPFEIDGHTLVPLRFVAQALGARVSYNGQTQTVAVVEPQGGRRVYAPDDNRAPAGRRPEDSLQHESQPPPPPHQDTNQNDRQHAQQLDLIRQEPGPDATVGQLHPQISATFPIAVDPNSVHVQVDGRDVAQLSYIGARAFSFTPTYELPPGSHQVHVEGRLQDGSPFTAGWSFDDRSEPKVDVLRDLRPSDGTAVGNHFVVRGETAPNAHVTVEATSSTRLPFVDARASTGSTTTQTTADRAGHFEAPVTVAGLPNGVIDVRIHSEAPNGSQITSVLRLRS